MAGGDRRGSLLLVGALIATVLTGCTSLTTVKSCSTVVACSAAGAGQFGQPVLTPRGATFVKGSMDNGVLGIEFRDPSSHQAYKEFIGRPTSANAGCPGTVITLSPTRRFCYGSTTTGLLAQFTAAKLLYSIQFSAPSKEVAFDQALVTRVVSSFS